MSFEISDGSQVVERSIQVHYEMHSSYTRLRAKSLLPFHIQMWKSYRVRGLPPSSLRYHLEAVDDGTYNHKLKLFPKNTLKLAV